ncbi:MAG: polyprenyl synthetase family protein, partial [Bacteroidota bacterium]
MSSTPANAIQLREKFVAYLNEHPFAKAPTGLYAPVDYILQAGGKRVRPVLTLLGAQLCGGDLPVTMPIALAVEIFHNFTLLHDDIMDDSPLRRGRATVHEKWDVNTAILSGDLMLIKAYEYLTKTPASWNLPIMLNVFNEVATGVCEGQQYDVDFESREDVTISEYLQMIELKTAVLLGGALQLGALAADASHEDAKRLYEFGRLTGIAFQLQDDLLDTFGTEEQIGKRVGNDIIRNKKTFLYLKALELANIDQTTTLQRWFQQWPEDPRQKVAEVTALMQHLGIPHLTAKLRDDFQTKAYAHLEAIDA